MYHPCPRYPQGTKWEVYQRSHRSSCAWNMETFNEALAYLRKMYGNAVRDAKLGRHPGDEYAILSFHGWINGPGGRMEWPTIKALVKH